MPRTKQWIVFYVAIGVGMAWGAIGYFVFFSAAHEVVHYPAVGVAIAGAFGLAIGFAFYLFFKFTLRTFTGLFLRQAQALTTRPIAELPKAWSSSELDKLEEVIDEALATLERLDLFSEIAGEIVATLDPQKTLGRIVATAVETLPATSGLIFLLDEESQRYTVRVHYLLPLLDGQTEQVSFAVGEGVPGWVVIQGQPLIISDVQTDERVHALIRRAGVKSLLSAPLSIGGRQIGALNLFSDEATDAFDEHDVHLTKVYADLAAVAIDNARLYQSVEDERHRFAAILSDTTDAIVVLDQAGQVLLFNSAAEACLGDLTTGQPIADLGVEDLVAALDDARRAKDSTVHEIAASGERTLHASVSPVHDVGWVIVMQDITSLKELDKLRTQWVAAVSHDLKNPIAAVQLSAGLMEKAGPLNDMQKEILEKMQRGSERLRSLVTDVLDLARLEAGPALRLGVVNPVEIIAETISDVEPLAADKELALMTDLPPELPTVRGDAALLGQVMTNLLSNAIKYTPSSGQVTVRVKPRDKALQIEVIDTGRGIPAESLPHIFDRFYRVPDSEEAEGTGLGLSIVKSIVEKHGGRVWVESEEGKGSMFAFTVPVSQEK
ncbi:MAG: GAF domain-containing protein [Anaerolineae bacterium]|nr:GAF domain-containing protein [Anaerolineae bacterium]